MAKLYQIDMSASGIGLNGVNTWEMSGDTITVEGVEMVRMSHGSIVSAKGWLSSRADALLATADRIDELRLRLIEQSARLRAEADKLTAKAAMEATT